MGAMTAYKVGGAHQHTPEMEQALAAAAGAPVTLSFTPMLAPMPRGILATCTAVLAPGSATADARATRCAQRVRRRAVRAACCPTARGPRPTAVARHQHVHLQVAADAHAGRARRGRARSTTSPRARPARRVQNANLVLGLPETAGLTAVGVAP